MKNLMSNGVISLLEMLLSDRNLLRSDSNDELSKAVLAIIAPATARDAYGRFKKLQCMVKGNFISVEVVLRFISDWNEELRWCESILPANGKLKALFLSQLKPDGLSANVSFNEPNSLSEAMKMAVTEAMSLADIFPMTVGMTCTKKLYCLCEDSSSDLASLTLLNSLMSSCAWAVSTNGNLCPFMTGL